MTLAELFKFEWLTKRSGLPEERATRQTMYVEEMGQELVEALANPDFSHLDPELNKLMR